MGPQGLLVLGLPAPFVPHSASLGPATATRVLSTPVPVSAPPTGLDECEFLFPWCRIPLPFDSLSVLVVRGGAVCLPTPPSWFSKEQPFYLKILFIKFYGGGGRNIERKRERERNINERGTFIDCLSYVPRQGTQPPTHTCALTRN